jgi:hypothetical protein
VKFVLEVDLDAGEIAANPVKELGRILRYWAGNLHYFQLVAGDGSEVSDSAYGEVGRWTITDSEPAQPTDPSPRADGLAALDVLVGEWSARVPAGTPPGRVVFEWALGGEFLIQRTETPRPAIPDSLAIIAYDADTDSYTQHYFDSRGVVRVYTMALRDGVWTLLRDEPDFSPLAFAQRFEGTFSADGNIIDARWETSHDGGAHWELDFPLTFTRVG